eukprot:c19366_g1_i1 orf=48-2024(+)
MPVGGLNLFGLHQYDNKTSFFNGQTVFSPGIGYLVICGYGGFFAVLTIFITVLDEKFGGTKYNSEEFNTAGRSVKTGLVAVDVVSHWTWVSTLLQSSNEAFTYGISGSFWYASGSAVQILLFGIAALAIKRRASKAHTVVELVRCRWGNLACVVFLYICYLNNIVVCASLFIGAGNALVAATGMNIYAAIMLIPLTIVAYTVIGGLKATFVSSYLHTVLIYVTLNLFVYKVYASGKYPVGSISKVWQNLRIYASVVPAQGNKDGSYLTMFSKGGLQFGVLNLIASFGNVWADQSYWQSAIAASPKAAFRSYILGGLLWIPIPFALTTSLGLSVLASDLPLTKDEANHGLVPIAAAQFILGGGGVILILTIVYMAVTSAGSAEFIAMSSLFTYDVYKAYIRPNASGNELLYVSRAAVLIIGIGMGALSCFLFKVHIDVNFLFLVIGLLVSSTVPPLTLMLVWASVPKGAAIASALGGQLCAIIAWLVHAKVVYTHLSVTGTLQEIGPTMTGTIVSVVVSGVICVVWTIVYPDTTDNYERFNEIHVMDDVDIIDHPDGAFKKDDSFRFTSMVALSLSVFMVVIWPLLTLPAGDFPKNYFSFWIIISMLWALIATIVCIFLPLLESRNAIIHVVKLMFSQKKRSLSLDHVTQPRNKEEFNE